MMPDYGAFPLWDNAGMLDPSNLPLQSETIVRLRRWAREFERWIDWSNPGAWPNVPRDVLQTFEQEGRSLWEAVRSELGEGYEVWYRSELTGQEIPPDELEG